MGGSVTTITKLRASILIKLELVGKGSDHLLLIKFWHFFFIQTVSPWLSLQYQYSLPKAQEFPFVSTRGIDRIGRSEWYVHAKWPTWSGLLAEWLARKAGDTFLIVEDKGGWKCCRFSFLFQSTLHFPALSDIFHTPMTQCVPWWPSGRDAGLAINRLQVRIPASAVECNSGQVVNTHVPLSPSSIIWY